MAATLLMVGGGIFTIVCAMSDFGWFWNHYKARALVRIIGQPAARVIYVLLGTFLLGIGVAAGLGWIR